MAGIFINYRRDESGGYAGRLHERLSRHFGRESVFIDVDDIPAGRDFVRILEQRITSCDVLLVVIGRQWHTITDPGGRRRLDDPADFVRIEINIALERKIPTVPILVGGARMPPPEALPGSIVRLAQLNALELHDAFFEESVRRLLTVLSPLVKGRSAAQWWKELDDPLRVVIAAGAVVVLGIAFTLYSASGNGRAPKTRDASSAAAPSSTQEIHPAPKIPVAHVLTPEVPHRTAALPRVVDAARGALGGYDVPLYEGPLNPRIAWQLEFDKESFDPKLIGVAGDGTIFATEQSSSEFVYAIRDGKMHWAYRMPDASGSWDLLRDGRICAQAGSGHYYCFNRDGEGGALSTGKDMAGLTQQSVGRSLWQNSVRGFHGVSGDCSSWEAKGSIPKTGDPWKVELDGPCLERTWAENGDFLVSTAAGSIYCIGPMGRVRWILKGSCEPKPLFEMRGEEAAYGCNGSLVGLKGGRAQWRFDPAAPSWLPKGNLAIPSSGELFFDKANTIYLAFEAPGVSLLALNHNGEVLWNRKVGKGNVTPRFLDKHGRLYVTWGGTGDMPVGIACLTDSSD